MTIPLIYLAGRYTEPHTFQIQRNIHLAERYAQEVAIAGGMPITPHLLSQNFDGIQDYVWWCQATMVVMRRCDAVLMLPRWQQSNGAVAEVTEALNLEIPVFYHLSELKLWLKS